MLVEDRVEEPLTKSVVVTTSWDDGHHLDSAMASLLARYGLAGTFYVAPESVELAPKDRLSRDALLDLHAAGFEIGGHTRTHQRLSQLSESESKAEIVSGKVVLEDLLGQSLKSFCYPGGEYSEVHTEQVREAGFEIGRTVRRFCTSTGSLLELGTTVHAYRHLVDLPACLDLAGFRPARAVRLWRGWDELAIHMFDTVMSEGGVFHLWGHSWEVEARGEWQTLERVLDHIGGRKEVLYTVNGDLAHRL